MDIYLQTARILKLDDNEYHGLDSFEATPVETLEEGTVLYSGSWKVPRPADPRHCD